MKSLEGFECRLCGGAGAEAFLLDCPDYYLGNPRRTDYVKCDQCALVQQYPMPEDSQSLYVNYPVHKPRNLLQKLARRLFHKIYFKPKEESESKLLLDYGCGDGSFLRDVEKKFSEVCGFEPGESHSSNLAERLGSIKVFGDKDRLLAEKLNSFDVLTAHFVVEHLENLHDTFDGFNKLLKANGLLYMVVPNIGSWEFFLFKRKWHGLDAPRHLIFPEPAHFEALAKQYGFSVVKAGYAPFSNTLAASLSSVLIGRHSSLLMVLLTLPCWIVSLVAPQGSLVIQMRKSGELMARADL